VLSDAPHPPRAVHELQAMQRRIQGAFFDAQDLVAALSWMQFRDVVAVISPWVRVFQISMSNGVAQQSPVSSFFLGIAMSPYLLKF